MTAPGGFVAGDVLGAADMNDLPGGVQGYATVTASQTGITGTTDITSLAVTFTALASRRYKITVQVYNVNVNSVGAGSDTLVLQIKEGSTVIGSHFWRIGGAAAVEPGACLVALASPAAGSVTYKATLVASGMNVDLAASSTTPLWIVVEDIGAA